MAHHADIKGLALILGGEIRSVSKLVSHPESAVILVRGPAGSGKTLLATQLAAHEALVRGGDVVYCCIELLPSELDAQIAGLTFGFEHRPLRVSNLPSSAPPPADLIPRIFASLIDVPETAEPDIGAELQRVMGDARGAQLDPRVIVIDSLAEGYRLGTTVPRYLADALAKFAAEEGILLLLLEEVVDQQDSTWTFVADVVLELAHHGTAGTSAAEERAITVRKNRFGPAQVGPHAFAIHRDRGIEIYPRLGAYLSVTARELLPQDVRQGTWPTWTIATKEGRVTIPRRGEVVLVTGQDPTVVSVVLDRLIPRESSLRLDMASATPSEKMILHFGDPLLGPERMLSEFCSKLEELSGAISGLAIGDLEAINHNIDPDGLRRALPVIIMIAQAAGLPVALYETASQHDPLSKHLADTLIRVRYQHRPSRIVANLSSRGQNVIDLEVQLGASFGI
jgi:KaiC/GvpD/RAD55 family RecA-like ATPase